MSLAGNRDRPAASPSLDTLVDDKEFSFVADTLPSSSQTLVNAQDDNDGFDDYNFNHFTRGELDWIDDTTRRRGKLGGANYWHQIEEGGAPEPLVDGQLARSPFDTFRAYQGYLTVSDIAGPSWCEFQTAYNYLAARNEKKQDETVEEPPRKKRKLEKEPEKGTQSKLDDMEKSSSTSGSATGAFLRRNQFRAPEEPLPSIVEDIPVYSSEDDVARRIVKEILCMDRLGRYGYCNGMDIFGIINGFIVTGKPDGVTQSIEHLRAARGASSYPTPSPSRRATPHDDEVKVEHLKEEPHDVEFTDIGSIKYEPSIAEVKLRHDGISVKPEPTSPGRLLQHHDVKFEQKDVQPDLDEPSRTVLTIWKRRPHPETYKPNNTTEHKSILMLMCYYRLLKDLFSPDYSFKPIWETLKVDGDRPLSIQFLKHADTFIRLDNTLCLNDLADEFFRRRAQVKNPYIDSILRISYEPSKRGISRPDFSYEYSEESLNSYLDSVLKWWRGERPAKGVPPESASRKCFKCKHYETCWWRRTEGGKKPLPPNPEPQS